MASGTNCHPGPPPPSEGPLGKLSPHPRQILSQTRSSVSQSHLQPGQARVPPPPALESFTWPHRQGLAATLCSLTVQFCLESFLLGRGKSSTEGERGGPTASGRFGARLVGSGSLFLDAEEIMGLQSVEIKEEPSCCGQTRGEAQRARGLPREAGQQGGREESGSGHPGPHSHQQGFGPKEPRGEPQKVTSTPRPTVPLKRGPGLWRKGAVGQAPGSEGPGRGIPTGVQGQACWPSAP